MTRADNLFKKFIASKSHTGHIPEEIEEFKKKDKPSNQRFQALFDKLL